MLESKIERVAIARLTPAARNPRTHSKRQLEQLAASIQRFGFTSPVLVDDAYRLLAGHGRVEAAKSLGLETVPVIRLSHLSDAEKRAYVIADNRLAEKAGWDPDLLALELQDLIDLEFDLDAIGFEIAEVDILLEAAANANPDGPDGEDVVPAAPGEAITRSGDLWILGRHRLLCGDARDAGAYERLMPGEQAAVMFTDPPYNVPIDGFAGGKGKTARREFEMASGEMSKREFEAFLVSTLGPAAARLADGAIAFVCMDWRHLGELLAAGETVFDEMKNLCVWNKSNAGMGSLYRSQHELVLVFKKGGGAHRNNVELGRHGRNRSNVWTYAGANAFGAQRDAELAMHPTVKPVALVADALMDVSKRGDLVVDPFGGSGSTLIAAEKCGRSARLIEIDAHYCDVIVARYEAYTGKQATLATTGASFEDVGPLRQAPTTSAAE